MTRRSGVYLEVPQRNAGLIDPHSLHIFYVRLSRINACKVIGVKIRRRSCQNHFCRRKHRSRSFGLRKTWRYKAAKQNERRSLCRSFLCSALKLLKPPSYAGYGSVRMERVTEKVPLFGSMNLSRQSLRWSPIRFCFGRGAIFSLCQLRSQWKLTFECMIERAESAFATNHLKPRAVM